MYTPISGDLNVYPDIHNRAAKIVTKFKYRCPSHVMTRRIKIYGGVITRLWQSQFEFLNFDFNSVYRVILLETY